MVSRHKRMAVAMAVAMAMGLVFAAGTSAADLQSVESVLARIGKPDTAAAKALSPAAALKKDIEAFRSRAPQLPAPGASAEWLALWDRSLALLDSDARSTTDYDAYDPATRTLVGPRSVLAALPAPEAWPLIREQATARAAKAPKAPQALGLRLIAEVLTHDAAAVQQSLAGFEKLAAADRLREREIKLSIINAAQALTYKLYGTREQIATSFRTTVDTAVKRSYGARVEVPNLVDLLGEAKAEALLAETLKRPVSLSAREGAATQALLRKLALREVRHLRKPQWGLVNGLGTAALYEAMRARFDSAARTPKGVSADDADFDTDYARSQADLYYFLDLVIAGRRAEAEALMARASQRPDEVYFPREALAELARQGQGEAVHAFLTDLLGRRPQLAAWDLYLPQAGALGHAKQALALIDTVLKRGDLSPSLRADLLENRLDALLGADQVDEAVAGLRLLLETPPSRDDVELGKRTDAAIRLASLGRVLQRPEWAKQGLDYATKAVALPPSRQDPGVSMSLPSLLAELRKQGAVDAAQALALGELDRKGDEVPFAGMAALAADLRKRAMLVELAGLYDAAGRHDDVRRLLDEVRVWGESDLAGLLIERDSMGTPVGMMAARALKAGGNVAGATAVVREVIRQWPGHDPAYQLFVDLVGESAIAELDGMTARDPFEERPLVWKAVALSRAGQYQAAEDAARRAIAIDPSDGEQGANDRMRAYAVLADVLEAKGDRSSAQGFRRAVSAIRLSEQTDELHKLGLYQRAFAGYRAALAEFSDAYCIQSRLAVQLAKQGLHDEALKHYRRAFELMPDSFGRVESHCFGCESVFAGPSAQAVADEVFAGLLKSAPTKPQVPYMLGYLRKQQGRYGEAVELFRRVIAMDARYLNAWRQLDELGEKTYIEPAERDIARLRLLELDPLQRHVRYKLDEVTDLAALWRAVARFEEGRVSPASSEPVYPLAASARAQRDALGQLPADMRAKMTKYLSARDSMAAPHARARAPSLADHQLLKAVLPIMGLPLDARGDE